MSANLPAILTQATDGSKSSTERMFAAVTLRRLLDGLIADLDDGTLIGGMDASQVDVAVGLAHDNGSGVYRLSSGTFERVSREEADRMLQSPNDGED